jgi:hypothetical protein
MNHKIFNYEARSANVHSGELLLFIVVSCLESLMYVHSLCRLSCLGAQPLQKPFLSTECDELLHFSNSIILSFPQGRPLSAYIFFLVFPLIFLSITRFRRQFLHKMRPIQSALLPFVICRTFLSSFLTRSAQLIFPIVLQHHISKLSRYFCSVLQSVQVFYESIKTKNGFTKSDSWKHGKASHECLSRLIYVKRVSQTNAMWT